METKQNMKIKMLKPIASGAYGNVYNGKFNNISVAIKREDVDSKNIKAEYLIYKQLNKKGDNIQIPKIYGFYKDSKYRYLIMQLLGSTLDDILEKNKIFDLETTISIAHKTLDLMEKFHNAGFIYRDVKPENFATDITCPNNIYLIDFGLSKIWDKKLTFRKKGFFIGTIRYASLYSHYRMELSKRDDLESLCYMWLYFLAGKLPWQGLRTDDMQSDTHVKEVLKIKKSIRDKKIFIKLFDTSPIEFYEILQYIWSLDFNKKPDYQTIRNKLEELRKKYSLDTNFNWKV